MINLQLSFVLKYYIEIETKAIAMATTCYELIKNYLHGDIDKIITHITPLSESK